MGRGPRARRTGRGRERQTPAPAVPTDSPPLWEPDADRESCASRDDLRPGTPLGFPGAAARHHGFRRPQGREASRESRPEARQRLEASSPRSSPSSPPPPPAQTPSAATVASVANPPAAIPTGTGIELTRWPRPPALPDAASAPAPARPATIAQACSSSSGGGTRREAGEDLGRRGDRALALLAARAVLDVSLEDTPALVHRALSPVLRDEAVELGATAVAVPQQERGHDRVLEGRAQPRQARVDRAAAKAEAVGELVGGEAAPDVQVEQRVLLGAQARRRGPDQLGELLRLDGLGRVVGRGVRELGEAEPEPFVREHAAAAAQLVDREVARDPVQPGLDARRPDALADRRPRARERPLHDVGGRVRVAQDPDSEVVQAGVMPLVELGEGVLVPRRGERGESFVGLVKGGGPRWPFAALSASPIVGGSAPGLNQAKSVRSGSRSPRSSPRSTSTQPIPRVSASVQACGLKL